MRTTIDLPEDLLEVAKSLARSHKQSLGQAVAELMRRGIDPPPPPRIGVSPISGLPALTFGGRTITAEDVAALDDEDVEYSASFLERG